MTYIAKQGLQAEVAKWRQFRKSKMLKSKSKDRWSFTRSLVEIEYILNGQHLSRGTYPSTLNVEKGHIMFCFLSS